MELLSPAGSAEKLEYAYRYGADAAYIGLPGFSLRAQAENISDNDPLAPEKLLSAKTRFSLQGARKRLYCAINIFFHDDDIRALKNSLSRLAEYPFDGFIVSDLGAFDILSERFPHAEFHLSTQANCTNPQAARVYKRMGFSRIVPGRELSVDEIKAIKDYVPDLEIEAFVHGAMCMAYSGRCFISSWLSGRSANKGDCTHSCRWHYKISLEEEKRPGMEIPVETGEAAHGPYTLVMSSRDLCMIDRLQELESAGVDSVKIEGRMKSLYYVALVTRAYRYALDHPGADNPYKNDLFEISHREYDTGFYFGRKGMDVSATHSYRQSHLFAGSVEKTPALADNNGDPLDIPGLVGRFADPAWSDPVYVDMKNTISASAALEIISPASTAARLASGEYRFFDKEGQTGERIRHGEAWFLQISKKVLAGENPGEGWLLRIENPQAGR